MKDTLNAESDDKIRARASRDRTTMQCNYPTTQRTKLESIRQTPSPLHNPYDRFVDVGASHSSHPKPGTLSSIVYHSNDAFHMNLSTPLTRAEHLSFRVIVSQGEHAILVVSRNNSIEFHRHLTVVRKAGSYNDWDKV